MEKQERNKVRKENGKKGDKKDKKDKGKGKDSKSGKWATPDGKKVCFAYQRGKCGTKNCQFLHVCKGCLKPWPSCSC